MSTPPLTVFCPSCSTKFSVADHIIRGKFVKFRCKKCQGTIECDGRALSSAPPAIRAGSRPPSIGPGGEPARKSEPPMRLSISDGLNLDAAAASLAPPKVPQLAAPALFTGPPTALPQSDETAPFRPSGYGPGVQTGDTPVEGHTKSDFPGPGQDGTSRTWRRAGIVVLVAAAGVGGWFLARESAPPATGSATAVVATPDGQHGNASDPGRAAATDLAKPAEPTDPTKTIEGAKAAVPTAVKAIDPTAMIAKAPPPRAPAKNAIAPAVAPAAPAAPAESPAAEATGPAAEAASAMAAVSNEHEFDKSAARSALEDAADHAASCRNIDTPAGAARVAVTFAPSGKVTSAVIESGPFVGTASGGCVASKFRNLHIPPFTSDDPVTVHKTLNF